MCNQLKNLGVMGIITAIIVIGTLINDCIRRYRSEIQKAAAAV